MGAEHHRLAAALTGTPLPLTLEEMQEDARREAQTRVAQERDRLAVKPIPPDHSAHRILVEALLRPGVHAAAESAAPSGMHAKLLKAVSR